MFRFFYLIIMCDTQTLAASTEGYIIRCADCGRMQLCFGIAAVVLKYEQFRRLQVHTSEALMYGSVYSTDPDRRAISVPVSKTTVLCLNWHELVALEDLVSQANALLEVYELLAKG
jgi:hypothetical protein